VEILYPTAEDAGLMKGFLMIYHFERMCKVNCGAGSAAAEFFLQKSLP